VAFWQSLKAGEYQSDRYKRFGKGGREIWIEASYNPLLDCSGKPFKVVKFATDITRQMQEQADLKGQVEAIGKSQAVIAFDLEGRILDANANFLAAIGYSLDEIRGQHHSLFVEPGSRASAEYQAFWRRLKAGEYQSGQYKRIGRGGREIWIEASYNPILDPSGHPYKVIKYATDITQQVSLLINLRRIVDSNFREIDLAVSQSNQEAQGAAHVVGSTSGNVQTMAAAAEELAASVSEIAHTMANSRIATDVAVAEVTNATALTDSCHGDGRHCQSDPGHCRSDQPAGAERHH
jgi:methyl-accepting chemotaxis protein